MSDDEKGKGKWANWKAQGGDVPGGLYEDEEPEIIFAMPPVSRLISDEEPTPLMGQVSVKNKTAHPAQEITLDQIQDRLRMESGRAAGMKREMESEKQGAKELEDIFEAVEAGNESVIKGLIVREFGNVEFDNLNDMQIRLDDFFSGSRDLSVNIDLTKSPPKNKKMSFVFRPRVAGAAPFVEVTLVNETGLGKAKNETITHVGSVKIVNPDGSPYVAAAKEKKTNWFSGMFGKKKK